MKHLLLGCWMAIGLHFPMRLDAANLVKNGGFEAGIFAPWVLSAGASDTQVSTGFPHSGLYGVLFGAPSSAEFLSQTLTTSPGQVYSLSFWMGSGDTGGGIPNEFFVKWADTTLLDQFNAVIPSWTNMQFMVTATSAATVITFGGWDTLDYVYLDEVVVSVPSSNPPPEIVKATLTNGVMTLGWTALVGRDYQLQYALGLAEPIWLDLGNPIRATSDVVSKPDPVGTSQRRYYRVVLLP